MMRGSQREGTVTEEQRQIGQPTSRKTRDTERGWKAGYGADGVGRRRDRKGRRSRRSYRNTEGDCLSRPGPSLTYTHSRHSGGRG